MGKLAQALLKPINTSAVIILGLYTFVWGAWIANPFWSVFSRAPLYDAMAVFAPEWVWGLFAIIVGIVMIYGVLKPSYRTLSNGALVSTWHWTTICVFYFVADWMSTGGVTCLMLGVYSAFIYLNIRVNRVLPDKQRREESENVEEQP